MIPIVIIISFFFDGIFSMMVNADTIFNSLFTLMALILIYPYFNKKNANYYKVCFLTGLFFDLVYTDTIIFNAFLFNLIGIIIVKLNELLANNPFNNSLMAVILIALFRLVTYFFLFLTGNIEFSYAILFKGIYSSLISNIVYVSLGYMITDAISRKLKIRKTT